MSKIRAAVANLRRCRISAALLLLATVSSLVYLYFSLSIAGRVQERQRQTVMTGSGETTLRAPTTPTPVTGAISYYKSLKTGEPLSLKCQSCALVSSSGILLGKAAGKEIDSHSCVIRMNMAPVEDYSKDVGMRTSLRVLNFFLFGLVPETLPKGSLLLVWGLYRRVPYLRRAMNMTDRIDAGGSFIYGQTFEGEKHAAKLFSKETGRGTPGVTKSWLSTGWFTLMLAIDICQDIHVYGMVPHDYCARRGGPDVPYHYYQPSRAKECQTYRIAERNKEGAHRYMTEKAVFARWALRHNISFHYPEWKLDRNRTSAKLDTPFINAFA